MTNVIDQPLVTEEQKEQYAAQGFFITDVLFEEETLAEVRSEFERLWQQRIEDVKDKPENSQLAARYRPFLARLQENSEICKAFCLHPVFVQLCRDLLGDDADLTWNQAVIKPPAPIDNNFPWHQDVWYGLKSKNYQVDSNLELLESADSAFTCWVAITRTIVDNGTLWVLPGRHREGLLPHTWNEDARDWHGQFDVSYKLPVVMQPGQILVFNKYLPHGSSANVSDETRMAYQIVYGVPGIKPLSSPDILPVLRDGHTVQI